MEFHADKKKEIILIVILVVIALAVIAGVIYISRKPTTEQEKTLTPEEAAEAFTAPMGPEEAKISEKLLEQMR